MDESIAKRQEQLDALTAQLSNIKQKLSSKGKALDADLNATEADLGKNRAVLEEIAQDIRKAEKDREVLYL
jgi:hypothetical protein